MLKFINNKCVQLKRGMLCQQNWSTRQVLSLFLGHVPYVNQRKTYSFLQGFWFAKVAKRIFGLRILAYLHLLIRSKKTLRFMRNSRFSEFRIRDFMLNKIQLYNSYLRAYFFLLYSRNKEEKIYANSSPKLKRKGSSFF